MTRIQTIDQIKSKLDKLTDEQLAAIAQMANALAEQPSVYSTLSDAEKTEIDAALDELDAGKGVPWETVKADLEARIKAAGK